MPNDCDVRPINVGCTFASPLDCRVLSVSGPPSTCYSCMIAAHRQSLLLPLCAFPLRGRAAVLKLSQTRLAGVGASGCLLAQCSHVSGCQPPRHDGRAARCDVQRVHHRGACGWATPEVVGAQCQFLVVDFQPQTQAGQSGWSSSVC